MKRLRRGDVCPCCGQLIYTDDPARLILLSWFAEHGHVPRTADEWVELVAEMDRDEKFSRPEAAE